MLSFNQIGRLLPVIGAAVLMFFLNLSAHAAMAPAPPASVSAPDVQLAWCAIGAHIGPIGGCIGGSGGRSRCWVNRWGHRVCD